MVMLLEPIRLSEMATNNETNTMPRERDAESGRYVKSYPPAVFLNALRDEGGMASTPEVADRVGCSGRLALNRLRDLEDNGEVDHRKVGNANLWILTEEAEA